MGLVEKEHQTGYGLLPCLICIVECTESITLIQAQPTVKKSLSTQNHWQNPEMGWLGSFASQF